MIANIKVLRIIQRVFHNGQKYRYGIYRRKDCFVSQCEATDTEISTMAKNRKAAKNFTNRLVSGIFR